jgi:hypothetical protein
MTYASHAASISLICVLFLCFSYSCQSVLSLSLSRVDLMEVFVRHYPRLFERKQTNLSYTSVNGTWQVTQASFEELVVHLLDFQYARIDPDFEV